MSVNKDFFSTPPPLHCQPHANHAQLLARLKKIPISDGFATQLLICEVVQTPHMNKNPIQTPNKLHDIEGGELLHDD